MEDSEMSRRRFGQHQTIFGNIHERNVTFCVDTSGSMYSCIETIKEQLCFALNQLAANQSSDISFNIIEFSTSVTKWSDKMVKCSEETVSLAKEWVRSLTPKTGTNTLDALLTAFSDESCDAVYLVTDGMPDQHPNEILDDVISVAGNRPVHCFYIQQGMQDGSAVAFLQELAMDSYGSFHVILTTRHGFIDKVTPVYRADMSAERIIRTSSGNIHPANNRVCRLATTVNDPAPFHYAAAPHWFPWQLYPYPFRHYFRHSYPYASLPFGPNMAKMYPYYGWSQFRPAKAWLKHAEAYIDAAGNAATLNSPGPGCLLIGKQVLARRRDDSFFYVGTVNSQLLNDKFLVALGPYKHGKYTDTTYEETFVYDIVAHDDALRHTILKGDRVLAPWQPDGERYAPGIVIEGQEKRIAEGGMEDVPLVVTFHDGQTATVPMGKAVWIPRALHERVTLELKLPPGVKRTLAEESEYPTHNAPGYPSSGPKADPEQFTVGAPQAMWPSPWLPDDRYRSGFYGGFYAYPPFVPPHATGSTWPAEGRRIEDMMPADWSLADAELRKKVASQIAEHESRCRTPPPNYHHHHQQQNGILTKKDALVSTDDLEQLRRQASKTLRFKDEATEWEAAYAAGDLEMARDSGHESLSDTDLVSCRYCSEDEGDLRHEHGDKPDTRNASVGTHDRTYTRHWARRSRSAGPRPPWRYWHQDEAPSLRDPLHYGPYAMGPYQESVPPVPLEAKAVKTGPQGVEWTAPVNCYVDTSACYRKSPGVMNSQVFMPRPPSGQRRKQGPGCEPGLAIGNNQLDTIRKQEVAAEYRRRETENRELQWQRAVAERVASRQSVEAQRRLDAQRRLEWEQSRQRADLAKMNEQREVRRALHDEIRMRGVMTQRADDEARYQREALLQRRADHQAMVQAQQEQSAVGAALQRQAMAQERAYARQEAVNQQLAAEQCRQREDAVRRREAAAVRSSAQRARSAVTARKVDIDVQLRAGSRGIHPTMLAH